MPTSRVPALVHSSQPALVHSGPSALSPVELDPTQRAAVAAALTEPVVSVAGAPGTGKTTTTLALATDLLTGRGLDARDLLVLTPSRRLAGQMRQHLALRAGATVNAPLVRTAPSIAFSILERFATGLGLPAPTLISGPEQDLILAELLEGHRADFAAGTARLELPPGIPEEVLSTRGFRDELRDVIMRASERGLDPVALDRLGAQHDRPQWRLAARLFEEYRDVTVLGQLTPDVGPKYDPAHVIAAAVDALAAWETELPNVSAPTWRHVLVDDHQESTAAVAKFLHFLVDNRSRLTVFGDPDSSVQSFRGAVPKMMGRAGAPSVPGNVNGEFGAHEVTLSTVWRHGPQLREVTKRIAASIPSSGTIRHRRTEPGHPEGRTGTSKVAILASAAQEHAYIARHLREAHLFHAVPWSEMAVIARSGAQVNALRRALIGASVPVSVLQSQTPLRDENAVRPLLNAIDVVASGHLEPEIAVELLLSPLGGMDAVTVRKLRRALRAEELSGGGGRNSDSLLTDLLLDPNRTATLPATVRTGARRVAAALHAGRTALSEPNATAQTVLWAIWDSTGLAQAWRNQALRGGETGARADRDLDAVLALFKAAERYVERTSRASVKQFADHVRSQELPADSLAAHGGLTDAVSVITPASAAGRQWQYVVVAGVQEGVWPDMRLRDSLLGAQALAEIDQTTHTDPIEARRQVLADEVRSFLVAVSRTQDNLLVTAVEDNETVPSALVDLVQAPPLDADEDQPDPRQVTVPPALDLHGLVAVLRHRLREALTVAEPGNDNPRGDLPNDAAKPETEAAALAGELAVLAANGVAAAHPDSWYHIHPTSSTAPVWAPDQQVRVSPSRIETVTNCALRWALEAAGGTPGDALDQSLGNLIHSIAEELPTGSAEQLTARLDERWEELGLGNGWPAKFARKRAEQMVDRLAIHFAASGEVVAVEVGFATTIGRAALSGKIDRLVNDSQGRLVAEDLKTGATAPSEAKARTNAQLGAYQLAIDNNAFNEVHGESGGAMLVYVGGTTKNPACRKQPALADSPNPDWARDLVLDVAQTMAQSGFTAKINDTCRTCPVRRSCPIQPEGRRVGASTGDKHKEQG